MLPPFYLGLVVAALWGIQPLMFKHLLSKLSASTIMLFTSSINFFLAAALYLVERKQVVSERIELYDIAILVFVPAATVFGANVLLLQALRGNSASTVSALIYSAPVFTVALSYVFLGERLRPVQLAGIAAIVGGVMLVA